MKIFLIVLLLVFSYIPKAEAVLCVVQTKDPRYKVASYVRNQTSCKTTQYANPADVTGKLILTILALQILNRVIDHIRSEDRKEEFLTALKNDKDAKVYQCTGSKPVDVITANGKAYAGLNGNFLVMDKFSSTAYRTTGDKGVIQFDLARNMMLVQGWSEKTARGGKCEFKGLLAEI